MSIYAITVTEFSRSLSDFLSQVQYQGQSLEIQRGKRVIARVLPAAASAGFPVDRLDELLAQGPQLSTAERAAMAGDLSAQRARLANLAPDARDPWAS